MQLSVYPGCIVGILTTCADIECVHGYLHLRLLPGLFSHPRHRCPKRFCIEAGIKNRACFSGLFYLCSIRRHSNFTGRRWFSFSDKPVSRTGYDRPLWRRIIFTCLRFPQFPHGLAVKTQSKTRCITRFQRQSRCAYLSGLYLVKPTCLSRHRCAARLDIVTVRRPAA